GVDPLRYRLAATPQLTAALERLLPDPDLVVVLAADAEALLARRAELTVEEITRQVGVWRRWADGRSNVVVLDATLPPSDAIDLVRRELERITPLR
ncbi:MAG TPA: hypothetical protein VMM13_03050, partial [Euzebya sp.]|nr:hypothetical protein [Euzebya sp.]